MCVCLTHSLNAAFYQGLYFPVQTKLVFGGSDYIMSERCDIHSLYPHLPLDLDLAEMDLASPIRLSVGTRPLPPEDLSTWSCLALILSFPSETFKQPEGRPLGLGVRPVRIGQWWQTPSILALGRQKQAKFIFYTKSPKQNKQLLPLEG